MASETIGSPFTQAGGVSSFATGFYTGDASGDSITPNIGFTPSWVKVIDITTNPNSYEWVLGMAATTTLLTTGSTGVVTVDTNSLITTNSTVESGSGPGYYAPGTSGPGDGTLVGQSFKYEKIDDTQPKLTFAAGLNTSTHTYVWYAGR